MTVESGQYGRVSKDVSGTITAIAECLEWTLQKTAPNRAYASCNTGGYKRTVVGTKQISGTIRTMYQRDTPIETFLDIGDRILLQLHTDATAGHKFWVVITGGPDYGQDIDDGLPPEANIQWMMDDPAPSFNTTLTAIP